MKNDFTIISNALSNESRKTIKKSQGDPIENSFYKPLILEYNQSVIGSLICIDVLPEDCIHKTGIIKARKQFLLALKYAVENFDTKTVLLAASTKRLFGKELELCVNSEGYLDNTSLSLQEQYPHILFTNGDNGTAAILNSEIDTILEKAEIASKNNTVVVNGLGLLGLDSLEFIIERDIADKQIVLISNHTKNLKEQSLFKNIKLFPNIRSIKLEENTKISAIINCTHNSLNLITNESLKAIQKGQPIYVIDVAVPYGFSEDEFEKCKNVYRQDGGNAYIQKGLEFYFNPEICGLTEKILYGCFTEIIVLSAYLKENPNAKDRIRNFDFFNVNKQTKRFVKNLFDNHGIGTHATSLNFMKLQ